MKSDIYQASALSQISHELRIPITGILGMVHFLEKTPLTPQQKDYISVIQTCAQQLLSLENRLYWLYKPDKSNYPTIKRSA